MARRRRRRNRHQDQDEGVDWRRTIFIILGVLIVLSMAISLVYPLLAVGALFLSVPVF